MKLATKSGFYAQFFKVVDGEPDSVYYTSDETDNLKGLYVCSQTYPVGVKVDPNDWKTSLKLNLDSTCKDVINLFRVGDQKLSKSDWEPSVVPDDRQKIEGWVFGYQEDSYSPDNQIQVMTAAGVEDFSLAQIKLTSDFDSCDFSDGDKTLHDQDSFDLEQELLPLGTPVAMYQEDSNRASDVFVHVLGKDGLPLDGEPPLNSVNQKLVESGLWILDSSTYIEKPDYVKPTMQKIKLDKHFLGDGPFAAEYAQLMLNAANAARAKPVEVLKACLAQGDQIFIDFWGKSDARGDVSAAGGSSGGGGGGCTYVHGYFRRGHYVHGYYRC